MGGQGQVVDAETAGRPESARRIVKAHDLEAGDVFRLTGEAEDPDERADARPYRVLKATRSAMRVPDMEAAGVDYRTAAEAVRTGTWSGPTRAFPGSTKLVVQAEGGPEKEWVVAPWVPLVLLERAGADRSKE